MALYEDGIINGVPRNEDGAIHACHTALEGSKKYFVSHDFSKKESWWQNSTRVTDEVLTNSGDDLTYTGIADRVWIKPLSISDRKDIETLSAADCLDLTDKSDREVIVKVDDSVVTTGFTVNHTASPPSVTFTSAQTGSTIKATYSYAGGSEYKIKPTSGKRLKVGYVELQASKGCIFPSGGFTFECHFENPELAGLTNPIKQRLYADPQDFINFGTVGVTLPAFGGLQHDVVVLPFNYMTCEVIEPHALMNGMWIQVKTVDDGIVTGDVELATITFYCLSEDI